MASSGIFSGGFSSSYMYEHAMANVDPSFEKLKLEMEGS